MYRNIIYDSITSNIILYTWNDNGDRIETVYPFKPYIYIESQSVKDALSIYNTPLRKVEFKNGFERRKYVKESGIKRIFYNIPVEQQFLIDHFGTQNGNKDFNKNDIKIFFLDIETYSPDAFPEPKVATDVINVISVYDSLSKTYYTWGLNKHYTPKESNVKYFNCINETELLKSFIRFWEADYPDVVTGWNIENFDTPYLINRINNVLGEDWAKKLSPVGKIFCKDGVVKRFGKVESKWYIKGVSLLDYLELYKVFARDKRESYALNHIAEIEIGEGKLAFNATGLSQLADTDWETFVDYNIQDTALLIKLEEKLKYIEICRMLAYTGFIQFEQALGTIQMVTGALALKGKEKNMIIPTFEAEHRLTYEGGYVKEPDRGLKEGVVSFDANSLYPNTIITLNISPETKLGKILAKSDNDVTIQLINGKEYTLDLPKFAEFVKKEKVAISRANILYTQKIKGICPELVEGIYATRVTNKSELKEHKKSLKHCKENSDKYTEHKRMVDQLSIMDYTLKILLNRIYGTFANKFSPFCDIDAASSITLTGQACVKQANIIINNHVNNTYGITTDLNIYNDTDSTYFTIKPILDKLNKKLLTDSGKVSQESYRIVEELEKILNDQITVWARQSLNSHDPRFVFKRESICDTGIFLQKKRYILHVLDDEGVEENKIKYVGVEVVSTSIPKKVKPLIKSIVETLIKTRDYDKVNELYAKVYEDYMQMPIEDIAFPKGIHDLNKYSSRSNGFSTPKSTPIHVNASIYYNLLLDRLNISAKYEKIRSGMKIKYFYTDVNKYNIDKIAFIDTYPTEFEINIDKDMMFKKTITPAIERLFDAVNWRLKDPNSSAVVDLFKLLS